MQHYLNEQNIFIFLVQVFLLLSTARILGELFRMGRQPSLTAEIIVGIIFGPTIFGRFLPAVHQMIFPPDIIQQNMLETFSWLGVLFLLLETGLEVDFTNAWRQKGDALKIAVADIFIPMVITFVPVLFLPDHFLVSPEKKIIFSIFMATVMTISAMPVTARVLHDLRLSKTDLGYLIMSALSVNDIIGWLIFTIVLGVFMQANFTFSAVFMIFSLTILFTIFCLTFGKRFTEYIITNFQERKFPEPASSFTFICLLGFLCGAVTQKTGIHALFGFFLAGVMAGGARALQERTRQIISQMVYALFVPIFFVNIGLKIDFLANFNLFLALSLSVLGIAARFFGAWIGVGLSRQDPVNRLAISIAHIPGGVMEIVISLIALEYNLITEQVFVAIVFGAVVSSVVLGPWLGYAIRRRKKVSIFEYFSKRSIIADLRTQWRDEAIRKLCHVVFEQEDVPDEDAIFNAVMQREQEMGTAIEEGIAVPHVRLPYIEEPVIAFGRSLSGIEWNSPDGQPSRFVFLILTPVKDDVQVQILSLISKTLSNKGVRDQILQAQDSQHIWNVLEPAFSQQDLIKR
ncbi:MAG: cation:proton antiporter [Candidatus Omnitrophota bacterium]